MSYLINNRKKKMIKLKKRKIRSNKETMCLGNSILISNKTSTNMQIIFKIILKKLKNNKK